MTEADLKTSSIDGEEKLGPTLKKRRQGLKLSLRQVEIDIKIRGRYLVMIEAGNYASLPDDIYSRGFVRNYAEYLGFDPASSLELYKKERKVYRAAKPDTSKPPVKSLPKPVGGPRWIVTPRTLVWLAGLSLVALVVAYIGWQVAALAAPPKISLDNPGDQVVSTGVIPLNGHIDPGSDLFINDSPVETNPDGSFQQKIALQDGVNTIRITAKNKLGKTRTITENILAHLPAVAVQPTPAAPFEGVDIVVKVNNNASWLIVLADGKEVFRGTMLAGTTQDFKAAGTLQLSVGNAGATELILTNKQVTQKDIPRLGNDGEVKQNIIFNTDTNIQ